MNKLASAIKSRKAVVAIVCVVVLAIVAVVVFFVTRGNAQNAGTETTTVQSATAETGSVSVTVTGTGTLANGSETSVDIPSGLTVDEVLVESGDSVEEGDTLATLDVASIASKLIEVKEELETVEDEIDSLSSDASDTTTTEYLEKIILESSYDELVATEETLTALLENPVITATASGTISEVNVSAGSSSSGSGSSSGSSSSAASLDSADSSTASASSSETATASYATGATGATGAGSTQASLTTVTYSTSSSAASSAGAARAGAAAGLLATADLSGGTGFSTAASLLSAAGTLASSENGEYTYDCDDFTITVNDAGQITALDIEVTAPVSGATPQTSLVSNDLFSAQISWNCTSGTFQADSVYTATILLTASSDAVTFFEDIVPTVSGATVTGRVLSDASGNADAVLLVKAQFAKTDSNNLSSFGTSGNSGGSSGSSGSSSSSSSSSSTDSSVISGSTDSSGSSSAGSSSDSSSGTSSSSSSSGSSSSVTSYTASTTTAFTIASDDEVTVTLSIDEADILSIETGQSVTVTLDALENESFTGEITEVSTSSSSGSSGSVKYSATVTIEKTDDMLVGMTASATINVNEADGAVLIPVNALQESGNRTFVYTELDSDGNPTGEVEVETGLSDGTNVEITSGLSEGDTVYYTKTESSSTSDAASLMGEMGDMGDMGGGDMGGGGGMSGGDMPDMSDSSDGGRGGGDMLPSGGGQ